MSRMTKLDHGPSDGTVPPVLQALAESSRQGEPSPRVEAALLHAWDARRGGAVGARLSRRQAWVWTAVGVGAVAASLLLAVLVRVPPTPAQAAPDLAAAVTRSRPGAAPVGAPVVVPVPSAVPSGPFEPPPAPRPAEATRATPAADRLQVAVEAPAGTRARRPAATAPPAAMADADHIDPFVWIAGADAVEPGLGLHVVRMTVPRARWEGRPPGADAVQADVLMGDDGLPRAVRVVRAAGRQ